MEPTPSEKQDLTWETLSLLEQTLLDYASREPHPLGRLNVESWPEAARALAEPVIASLSARGLIILDGGFNFTLASEEIKNKIREITEYVHPEHTGQQLIQADNIGWLID